ERLDVAVVRVDAERLGAELVRALTAGRDDLEDPVLVAGMDAVQVDGMWMAGLVRERDLHVVALRDADERPRDGAVVGPSVPLHALGDLEDRVLRRQRELPHAARLR